MIFPVWKVLEKSVETCGKNDLKKRNIKKRKGLLRFRKEEKSPQKFSTNFSFRKTRKNDKKREKKAFFHKRLSFFKQQGKKRMK